MSTALAEAPATAPTAAQCRHCGLPVPPGLVDPDAPNQFCCTGCRTAYAIINGCGLRHYYHVRDEAAADRSPVRATGKRYGEMDDPAFAALYVIPTSEGRRTVDLFLEGVHCAACVWLVERLPDVVPGVMEARLDPRRALVRVTWDPAVASLSTIARALDSLGYIPHAARDARSRSIRRIEDRKMLVRLGVAGACAGNVMLLALALYSGALSSMEPQYLRLFLWLSMAISLISLAWPGSVFFRGAWAAIRTRTPHLDLPISIGLAAGAGWGIVNTIRGSDQVYFDSLSVLVFALLIGRAIQQRQQRWSSDALELLFSVTPGSARRVEPDGTVEVPVEALTRGDLVEVLAGDSIPVDGAVEFGTSSVDQSLLTGESVPVIVAPGDAVAAGAVNLSAPLRVRATATGEATRIGKLMRMVEEGARRKAPIARLADRVAANFVAGMLALSVATLVLWLVIDPSRALDNAAALLIVTCPCAVGLATPLAITVAIGRGAKRGVLIKGGDALEALSRPGVIFLDKTGTITRGTMSMISWHGPTDIQPLVGALESSSSHPIARALAAALPAGDDPEAADIVQTLGSGIRGVVNGRDVVVGSPAWIRASAHLVDPDITRAEHDCVARGLTPILIAIDGVAQAVAGVGDPIRDDTADAVHQLQRAGWDVRILSGDHPGVVAAAAKSLGITNARGGASPEDKLLAVGDAARDARVIMVGDGVNDAAALAAATVGIAVHGGAEASLAAADVYLCRPGLSQVLELLRAARSTLAVIRASLAVSLFYNILAGTLAITGVLNPLIAAVIMPVSSLTVLTLAVCARTFRSEPCR